ncbi:MAG: hypothetical protein FWC16_00425 [Defluviitaleaceae bacterium]|nr:hypothetical protein [Defluviitaleaceae bacterium]MCL2273368.1 hypothetical protein [Defluviitaleaceae bacterium]
MMKKKCGYWAALVALIVSISAVLPLNTVAYDINEYECFYISYSQYLFEVKCKQHHCCINLYNELENLKMEDLIEAQPYSLFCLLGPCFPQITNSTTPVTGGPNATFCSYRIQTVTLTCLACQRPMGQQEHRSFEVSHTWVPLPNAPGHAFCSRCGFSV